MSARQLTLLWVCAFVVFASFYMRAPRLRDFDSYYHLAVARHYVENGVAEPLPWFQFSLLSTGADKEWLFHLLLMPFAALPDAALGGRLALAVFGATIATLIAAIAAHALGTAALAVPLWLWLSAPAFFDRMMRLRPELLALILILAAILAAANRRYRLLAVLAFAFAAGYTAFHVFLALVLLWEMWRWYSTRKVDLKPIALAVAGAAAGLLLRPYPIANLHLWYVQNVLFFRNISRLDVGREIFPPVFPHEVISASVWLATLAVLALVVWRSRVDRSDRNLLVCTAIAGALFLLLFLRMWRMATYVYPLLALTVLLAAGRPRHTARVVAVLLLGAIAGAALTLDTRVREIVFPSSIDIAELDYWRFGRAVPPGAKIASTWGETEVNVFWAPQGRYLNALDPLFMAHPYPREYAAQRVLFSGGDPDVPRTVRQVLGSDYIAVDVMVSSPVFLERLRGDPRLETIYPGYNALLRIRDISNPSFVTEWDGVPASGFVDVTRLARDGCATVRHRFELDEASEIRFAFAPWGPSVLSIDGVERASNTDAPLAIFGRGKNIDVALEAGAHFLDVKTCMAHGTAGFYLRRERGLSAEK